MSNIRLFLKIEINWEIYDPFQARTPGTAYAQRLPVTRAYSKITGTPHFLPSHCVPAQGVATLKNQHFKSRRPWLILP